MGKRAVPDPVLAPSHGADLEQVREHCRRLVRRRALISAGASAVPIPGLDVMSDVSLFTLLIRDINGAFGLTSEQIGMLQPRLRVIAYEAAIGMGGIMIGKLVTRELVLQLFRRAGLKSLAKSAARIVPVAGQIASAAIGFSVFRAMGYQHIEACIVVVRQLQTASLEIDAS